MKLRSDFVLKKRSRHTRKTLGPCEISLLMSNKTRLFFPMILSVSKQGYKIIIIILCDADAKFAPTVCSRHAMLEH